MAADKLDRRKMTFIRRNSTQRVPNAYAALEMNLPHGYLKSQHANQLHPREELALNIEAEMKERVPQRRVPIRGSRKAAHP